MTPEQQRVAIAEACGWTQIEPCTCCDGVSRGYQPTPGAHKKHLPDYLNDLNAMHEAQNSLTAEQARCYDRELQKIGYQNRLAGAFWLWHFPAKWKAEAFLRTIGKWKECK